VIELAVLADLTAEAMHLGSVEAWVRANERAVARAAAMFTELRRADKHDITTLSVALRNLHNLSLTTRRTHS
jgi:glutamate dehydrogenase